MGLGVQGLGSIRVLGFELWGFKGLQDFKVL
jgi:hypothetical protein